jgi:hypothetical protein
MPCGLAMRLRNKIRSSGTPRDLSTSAAMMAEPPGRKKSLVLAACLGISVLVD